MLSVVAVALLLTAPEGPVMAQQKQEVIPGKWMTPLAPPSHPSITINRLSGMKNVGEHIYREAITNMFSHEGCYPQLKHIAFCSAASDLHLITAL